MKWLTSCKWIDVMFYALGTALYLGFLAGCMMMTYELTRMFLAIKGALSCQ